MSLVFTLPYLVKKQLFSTFRTMHFLYSGPTEFTTQLPLYSADAVENPIVEAVTVDLSFVDVN
jgi:hypothetical protein